MTGTTLEEYGCQLVAHSASKGRSYETFRCNGKLFAALIDDRPVYRLQVIGPASDKDELAKLVEESR